MASSLSESCNASKHAYDTCFNHWFKTYLVLVAPPLASAADTSAGKKERDARDKAIALKKGQYESQCGELYKSYQGCLKSAIAGKDGLGPMVESARAEEPLDSWAGFKVTTEEDL